MSASCLSCAGHEAEVGSQSPAQVQNRPCAAQCMQPPSRRGWQQACCVCCYGAGLCDKRYDCLAYACKGLFYDFPQCCLYLYWGSVISLTPPPVPCWPALQKQYSTAACRSTARSCMICCRDSHADCCPFPWNIVPELVLCLPADLQRGGA